MKNLLALLHLAVLTAKLCGPGGVRAVIAENLVLKQQLIVLRRARRRAPNLTLTDRLLCGFGSLFLNPGRIRKLAIAVRPSTLLAFHAGLVRRKYRRLFSLRSSPKKPGPKGPAEALIRAIVELKSRNPRFSTLCCSGMRVIWNGSLPSSRFPTMRRAATHRWRATRRWPSLVEARWSVPI